MISSLLARHHGCCGRGASPKDPHAFAPAGTERKYERSRPFAVTHLALDLDLDLDREEVSGIAKLDFGRRSRSGTSLTLDAIGFAIEEVFVNAEGWAPSTRQEGEGYTYDGETISIPIDATMDAGQVTIRYRAAPKAGLYFLKPDEQVPQRPTQVWSQCQDEDARHWFPCQDKPHAKMTTELRVRVPDGMIALSNGELVFSGHERERRVFHYQFSTPHPAYLVTLVVGHFDEWSEEIQLPSGRNVTLRYLVPPGRVEEGRRAFADTGQMVRLLSEKTGIEYPWSSYTQVVVSDFIFGGMENTTATTMYEHILLDERAAIDIDSHDLVAHELAHQWFGDLVTCRDWSHAWLNEGFATFIEMIEREERLGRDELDAWVVSDLERYLSEAHGDYQRPIVFRDYEEPIDLFDRHLYQKGGIVLHMLRRRLGDEVFWRGVHNYLNKHRQGIVSTTDLIAEFEAASGEGLERFFDEWVFRPGHPDLDVSVSYSDGMFEVTVEQKQSGNDVPVFEIDLEVSLSSGGTWTTHHKRIASKKDVLSVRTFVRPQGVVINPNLKVVCPIKVSGPEDLFVYTAKHAETAYGRCQALQALGKKESLRSLETFEEVLANEDESYLVRATAAEGLGGLRSGRAKKALERAASSPNPKVRRAVAAALGETADPSFKDLLVHLTQDASYLVAAAAARSLGKLAPDLARDALVPLLERDSWADVVRAGALEGLASLGGEVATPFLISESRYGRPLRSRRTAIAALGRVGEGRKVREHLEKLLMDRDPHIRAAILRALADLGDTQARGAIRGLLERETDGRVLRPAKKALASLGADKRAGLHQAKRDITNLENELRTVKLKLSQLEARIPKTKAKDAKDKEKKAKKRER